MFCTRRHRVRVDNDEQKSSSNIGNTSSFLYPLQPFPDSCNGSGQFHKLETLCTLTQFLSHVPLSRWEAKTMLPECTTYVHSIIIVLLCLLVRMLHVVGGKYSCSIRNVHHHYRHFLVSVNVSTPFHKPPGPSLQLKHMDIFVVKIVVVVIGNFNRRRW